MRVLFLIPKSDAPTLEGNFSKAFKEFVSLCVQKDPTKRPSAEELLKHRFIKGAKKTSYLTELIERHEKWQADGGKNGDDADDEAAQTCVTVCGRLSPPLRTARAPPPPRPWRIGGV